MHDRFSFLFATIRDPARFISGTAYKFRFIITRADKYLLQFVRCPNIVPSMRCHANKVTTFGFCISLLAKVYLTTLL